MVQFSPQIRTAGDIQREIVAKIVFEFLAHEPDMLPVSHAFEHVRTEKEPITGKALTQRVNEHVIGGVDYQRHSFVGFDPFV